MENQRQHNRQNSSPEKRKLFINIPASDLNRAIYGTENAVQQAEADGVVTREQDDKLTMNTHSIGSLVDNACKLVAMLEKSGLKGIAYQEACKHLERLRLQQYRAMAADHRLNCNEVAQNKPPTQLENTQDNEMAEFNTKPKTIRLKFSNAGEKRFFRSIAHDHLKTTRKAHTHTIANSAMFEKIRDKQAQREH